MSAPPPPRPQMPGDDVALAERKRVLRARMRAITRAIAGQPDRRAQRSRAACERLASIVDRHLGARSGPAKVMVFASWRTEVDLSHFVAWCAERGLEVYTPEVDGDRLRVVPGDLDPAELAVVVVPALAFTASGERLGRGAGHYDRFLRRLSPGCLRVGIVFAEQVVDAIPTAAHDVSVDTVVAA